MEDRESQPIIATNKSKPSFLDQLLCCFHDDGHKEDSNEIRCISDIDAVFLLLNTMVGAGVLQQAMAFEYCGIGSGVVLFVVIGYFTYLGANTLAGLADTSGCGEYAEIAFKANGFWGALSVDTSIVLFNFTTVVMYIIYMGSLMNDLIDSYVPGINDWYASQSFLSTILTLCVALPICFVRTFDRLTAVSYFSVFLMILVAFIICIDGAIVGKSSEAGDVQWYSFTGSLSAMGNLVYSLGFSPAVLFTYNSMDKKYKKDMTHVVLWAVLGGTAICFSVGVTGYVLFGNATNSNIIFNLSGVSARICDIAMVVHFALFLPGDFFILRASIYNLIYDYIPGGRFCPTKKSDHNSSEFVPAPSSILHGAEGGNESEEDSSPLISNNRPALLSDRLEHLDEWTYTVFTITVLIVIMVTGIVVELFMSVSSPYFNFFLTFIGGLSGSVDTFIMPGLCGLHFFEKGSDRYMKCYALVAFGAICSISIVIGSFLYIA